MTRGAQADELNGERLQVRIAELEVGFTQRA
ncbi:UNVERIFIED_ORG: hypothetical protein J2W82_005244 [Pseudomonas mohnii]|nr:hypothetical protein [Pseudomonas mohnii]